MRISKVHLLGLALLAGAAADKAAADTTVSNATTTPLATSTAGEITVESGGSITVDANEAAITVDSNNDDIAQGGTLRSNDANGTRGIVLGGGFSADIVNSGAINLLEDYTLEDTDSDGNLDGNFATGSNRVGILSNGAFTGDITNSGSITVEGNTSAGIRLDGPLTGNLLSSGAIQVTGDNSQGVAINDSVTGNVTLTGPITIKGQNSIGALINGPITGALSFNGATTVTGYHSTTRPTTDAGLAALDPEDLEQSGSAIDIRSSVSAGVTFQGIGVEDDLDDDDDGVLETDDDPDTTDDANDDATTSITVFGSAPAVQIAPDTTTPTAIVIGAGASTYGVNNRGSIRAAGIYDGVDATAMRIDGQSGATVTVTGGVLNDGALTASAAEADATALYVGDFTSVSRVTNRNQIVTSVTSDGADNAYGVYLAAGANTPTLNNSGAIRATVTGNDANAVAIFDGSNSLSSITNSGSIVAEIDSVDTDTTDDVDPVVTGHAYAIDVSGSSIGITLNQVADTPFTDDDSVDDDEDARPPVQIVGDVRLGGGADTVNLLAGSITGDIAFGAGADAMTIDNGAVFTGVLNDSDGALTLNVADGALNLGAGQLDITSAAFGADGSLGVVLAEDAADSTRIIASGAVTFAQGATVSAVVPAGLPQSGVRTFLTANGGLTGANFVTGDVADGSAPYLYNVSIGVAQGDPNSLAATFAIKTAAQLGLNSYQAQALDPIIAGLRLNSDAAAALSGLRTQYDFINAYEDLVPSFASSAAELAATAIQQQQSTASNRLAAYRLGQIRNPSIWGQEIGYGLNRDPGANGQEYRGYGFGFAGGFDRPLSNGALAGASVSFIASQVEEPGRPDGEVAATFGQLNGYYGTSFGAVNVDFVAGAGAGKLQSRRFIEIGPSFSALSEADWWAYEGHGAVHLSLPMQMGRWVVTPKTALTYVALNEQSYTESGAGAGLDYDADSALTQRLWGDVGIEFGARFGRDNDPRANVIAPRLMLGYRANLIDEGADRTFHVAAGGQEFTLTDAGYGDGGPLVALGFTAGSAYSSFSLGYEGEFGDEITRHSLNASVRINF